MSRQRIGAHVFGIILALVLVAAETLPVHGQKEPARPALTTPTRGDSAPATGPGAPSTTSSLSDAALVAPSADLPADAVSRRLPAMSLDSAFVTDRDLGAGRRLAIISPTPINYRAEDGSWQPIDPRFEAVPGGFLNETNSLVIRAAERQAALHLRQGEMVVAWEPAGLAAVGGAREEIVLARPVRAETAPAGELSGDEHTIRYAGQWTWAGLSEEVTAARGRVEQRLVVAARPSPPSGAVEVLRFQAMLELAPGERLYADGAYQAAAFATGGQIEVRDAQGQAALALAPPAAFELGRPASRVAGRSRLAPLGQGRWQVTVETPWAWWANPGRRYPAAIETATVYELQALETAEIHSASDPLCTTPPVPPFQGDFEGQTVGVGTTQYCGAVRTLLRFHDLPSLPPGYTISNAWLSIIPARGAYMWLDPKSPGYAPQWMYTTAEVSLYRVRPGAVWEASAVDWAHQPDVDPAPLTLKGTDDTSHIFMVGAPEHWQKTGSNPVHYGAVWTLQEGPNGLVSDWLAGQNEGLLLRAVDESACSGPDWGPKACRLVAIPTENVWTEADKRFLYITPSTLAMWGGFALAIEYTPPLLEDGEPVIHTNPLALPDPVGDLYWRDFHSYLWPEHTGWMAVGAKGLDQVVDGDETYYLPAGNLGVGAWTGQYPQAPLSTGDYGAKPNYLVFHPGDPAHAPVEIQPLSDAGPATANVETYMVEAVTAADLPGDPTFSAGITLPYTFHMSSTHILKVLNLNLVDNTRVAVEVQGYGAEGRLFAPQAQPVTQAKDQAWSADPFLTLGSGQGGTWGLVIEYPGYVVSPDWGADPISLEIGVTIRACGLNEVPTPNGCEVVNCPAVTACHNVGAYKICSEAGFDPGSLTGEYTSRIFDTDGTPYATCIGWEGGATDRWVVVNREPVHFHTQGTLSLEGSDQSIVSLGLFSGPTPVKILPLWRNTFIGYPDDANPLWGSLTTEPSAGANYVGLPLDGSDAGQASLKVSVPHQVAEGQATLNREVETGPGQSMAFIFRLDWQVAAEGYGSSPPAIVTEVGGPVEAQVSSLTLIYGSNWTIDLDPGLNKPTGLYTVLRCPSQIAQPAELGGAWRPVQAVILPRGKGLPSLNGETPCAGTHCWEPRAMDDALGNLHREWLMPDVEVTGLAKTVAYDQPGQVVAYSTDHPQAVNDVGVPFSFRFLDAEVTVAREPCLPNEPVATVIRGQSKIVVPGLGNGTDPPLMDASFKLCETSLRQVSMTLKVVGPGLPVGSTGVFVDSVSGTIWVGPDHTQVTLGIHYKAGAKGEVLTSNYCNVMVDTGGLFDMSTGGIVIGTLSYDGHVWVAFNPMDVGVDVGLNVDFQVVRIDGRVTAHVWQGQGWQNRYWWLPPDDAMHMTGSFRADITLKEGSILSCDYCVDLPPDDVELYSINLAFGQFCGNGCGCQCYEWGFKAVFNAWYTLWQDVGLYYGGGSLGFILGSDGYVLIDQYAQAAAEGSGGPATATWLSSAGRPLNLRRRAVADPLASPVTVPLTMTQWTGSALIGLGCENADPKAELTLIRPDGKEITPANAQAYGVEVRENYQGRMYGVSDPVPGVWQAQISNAAGGDYWHLTYFANKKMPEISLTSPAGVVPWQTTTPYPIQWTVPDDLPPGVDVRVSLFYTATAAGALTTTQVYGGQIAQNLPLTDGQHNWDLSWLAEGKYQVYGQISDGGDDYYLPQPSPTSTHQLPGVLTVVALGSLVLDDPTVPQVPQNLSWIGLTEGGKVCWDVVPDHDLAGYLLHYQAVDVYGAPRDHTLRVLATQPYTPGARQCARIGGLNDDTEVAVEAAAYDASGNISSYGEAVQGPVSAGVPSYAPPVGILNAAAEPDHSVSLNWTGVVTPGLVSGYQLFYAKDQLAGPGQTGTGAVEGSSPITVGKVTNLTLHGLEPGFKFYFAVRAYDYAGRVHPLAAGQDRQTGLSAADPEARLGPLTDNVGLWLTDGVNGDYDRMPDDWENAYGVSQPEADPDRDCLLNWEEYQAGTHPQRSDTDGDAFSDGEEYLGDSDPLDGHSLPEHHAHLPRLGLDPTHLTFRTGTANGNPPAQWIKVENRGMGDLEVQASTTDPWPSVQAVEGGLWVQVDKSGLPRGVYRGAITVAGAPGSCTQDSPQTITVDLILYEGLLRPYWTSLPLVVKAWR